MDIKACFRTFRINTYDRIFAPIDDVCGGLFISRFTAGVYDLIAFFAEVAFKRVVADAKAVKLVRVCVRVAVEHVLSEIIRKALDIGFVFGHAEGLLVRCEFNEFHIDFRARFHKATRVDDLPRRRFTGLYAGINAAEFRVRVRRTYGCLVARGEVPFHPRDIFHDRVTLSHDFHDRVELALGI